MILYESCILIQQEDRQAYLRTHASQLIEEAKLKGTTNVEHESPTSEVNPLLENKSMGTPPEFRKNPFTLVKKKNLKQLTPSEYLNEEKEKSVDKTKGNFQKFIQNPIRDLRWSVLRKQLTAFSCQLFSQDATSQMVDRVLNTSFALTVNLKFLFDFEVK